MAQLGTVDTYEEVICVILGALLLLDLFTWLKVRRRGTALTCLLLVTASILAYAGSFSYYLAKGHNLPLVPAPNRWVGLLDVAGLLLAFVGVGYGVSSAVRREPGCVGVVLLSMCTALVWFPTLFV